MCRHSDYFYEYILKHGLITECIVCCSDKDPGTRKFACFALGNAAFHNDKLYMALKPSIPHIINLLKDKDERTRANASGALGNFARNSAVMINELITQNAVDALFQLAVKDPSLVSKL
jgi:fused-like protein